MEERAKRKLTAILSADVKGYSRLMGEDELATIDTLKKYRKLMAKLIQEFRGRVVDSPGDNLLAEFSSVIDALECAVEIQKKLKLSNEQLPEDRRMEFRIGVNLGDVVEDGKRIYGDGVNIAARVESQADGGGICISGSAYDQIVKKLPLGYEYLGEQTVKNIEKPVRLYRVLMEPEAAGKVIGEKRPRRLRWAAIPIAIIVVVGGLLIWNFNFRSPSIEPASVDRMAFPLPDKPSIAVLPFVNISNDPKQEYLADGITENIISALSQVPMMFVIARNSTFTYKGKPVKVKKVAEELGVRYVLEGAVQRSGDRIRITAQLIDALTGHHLWAERYDRDLRDIFALQDEITMKIITALEVELTEGEQARVYAKGTESLQAYLKLLEGREYARRQTREDNILARHMAKEAVALDPNYPAAYNLLAFTHMMDVALQTTKLPEQSMKRAIELAQAAIDLDESLPDAHGLLSFLYTMLGQHDKGIVEGKRAVALDPNGANSHAWLSTALRYAGRHEEALQAAEKALRLNPFRPDHYFFRTVAAAYIHVGRYKEAIAACKNGLNSAPNDIYTHSYLATAYSLSGREDEARSEAEEILRIDPKFSLESAAKTWPYKNQADRDLIIDALRKSGLSETPPLPLPDKPSIAVLPFVNMSGDPEQEYFSDGLTEEIISALSRVPRLFVIARNSTFTYKGKPVKVQQVGRDLGVRYVLEGSVRKAGNKLRITAQLVDAKTGNHLWAERYDRELRDIFAVQDEITMKIITALDIKLTEGEAAPRFAKGTNNLEVYLKVLQAREHAYRGTKEDTALCRKLLEEAISMDPDYAVAYGGLGFMHLADVMLGSSKSLEESYARAIELAEKSLSLDDNYLGGRALLCRIYSMKGQHDKAIAEGERSVALDPNWAFGHMQLAIALNNAGRPEEAIRMVNRAIRLNPLPPPSYFITLGDTCRLMKRYSEAIRAYKKAIDGSPNSLFPHLGLAVTYSELGREEEAMSEAAEVLRIVPKFSLEYFSKTLSFKNQADRDSFIAALRKAGLK